MSAETHDPRLPDESVLRAHAHCIGNTGSGKGGTLLAALGLEYGDIYARSFFMGLLSETLAKFRAEFEDVPPPVATDDAEPNH